MSFDAKTGILKAINETNDPAMKTVLLLLLGVFEEIGNKIDSVLSNEQALRATVLNGHEPVHHKHHEWIDVRMARDKELEELIDWVKAKKAAEANNATSSRKIRDDLIAKALSWALAGVLGVVAGKAGFF